MTTRLFVGNLSWDTQEDDLIQAFEQDGLPRSGEPGDHAEGRPSGEEFGERLDHEAPRQIGGKFGE